MSDNQSSNGEIVKKDFQLSMLKWMVATLIILVTIEFIWSALLLRELRSHQKEVDELKMVPTIEGTVEPAPSPS